MNRAIPRPSSPIVATLEPACHAGGRGFHSRRSRSGAAASGPAAADVQRPDQPASATRPAQRSTTLCVSHAYDLLQTPMVLCRREIHDQLPAFYGVEAACDRFCLFAGLSSRPFRSGVSQRLGEVEAPWGITERDSEDEPCHAPQVRLLSGRPNLLICRHFLERMKGFEPSTFCMASASDCSRPFAPVRSNELFAGLSVRPSERERTRANAEPCHSCHADRAPEPDSASSSGRSACSRRAGGTSVHCRPVTPEVAGSIPVAPVENILQIGIFCCLARRGDRRSRRKPRDDLEGRERCVCAGTFAVSCRNARLLIPHDSHPDHKKRSEGLRRGRRVRVRHTPLQSLGMGLLARTTACNGVTQEQYEETVRKRTGGKSRMESLSDWPVEEPAELIPILEEVGVQGPEVCPTRHTYVSA